MIKNLLLSGILALGVMTPAFADYSTISETGTINTNGTPIYMPTNMDIVTGTNCDAASLSIESFTPETTRNKLYDLMISHILSDESTNTLSYALMDLSIARTFAQEGNVDGYRDFCRFALHKVHAVFDELNSTIRSINTISSDFFPEFEMNWEALESSIDSSPPPADWTSDELGGLCNQ